MRLLASRRPPGVRAFTLLEVLVAIAILGMGLTAILSAQTGLFASSKRVERLSVATNLARCKMNEVELELLQNGYPLADTHDQGDCCNDERIDGFQCLWTVERVVLPAAPSFEDSSEEGEGEGDEGSSSGLGALGSLMTGQTELGAGSDIGDLAQTLGGTGGGADGIAAMVMGMVYPALKPMLEASIRKVRVTVQWKEGSIERDLEIIQFVTNPQQGGLDPEAAEGLAEAVESQGNSLGNLLGGGNPQGATQAAPQGGGLRR